MPVAGRVRTRDDAIEFEPGHDPLDFVGADDVHFEADTFRHPVEVPEPVEIVLGSGQPDTAGRMPAYVLAGHLLEPRVQVVAVRVYLGEIVVADETRALTCGMPGGSGCQFTFLDKQAISATFFSQVVQEADTHDAATHDDDLRMCLYDLLPIQFSAGLYRAKASTS